LQYVRGDGSPGVERSQQKAINLTAVMFSSSFEQASISQVRKSQWIGLWWIHAHRKHGYCYTTRS